MKRGKAQTTPSGETAGLPVKSERESGFQAAIDMLIAQGYRCGWQQTLGIGGYLEGWVGPGTVPVIIAQRWETGSYEFYRPVTQSTKIADTHEALEKCTAKRDDAEIPSGEQPASVEDSTRAELIRRYAREQHHVDGQVEIDQDAAVSEGDDNGAYVRAWVWADFSGTELDKVEVPNA